MNIAVLPSEVTFFQACSVRGHLRLLAAGMTNSRLSGSEILAKASEFTAKKYKRGQYKIALEDLTAWIEENK